MFRPTRLPLLVLLACAVFTAVTAHTIDIPAKSRECFFEDLHSEDKVRYGAGWLRWWGRWLTRVVFCFR